MSQKIAVVLFNLGGPDTLKSVRPFLYNFFMDPKIINISLPLRWVLASFISYTRSKTKAKDIYSKLGGRSPILENTQAQSAALEKELAGNNEDKFFKCFVCMRYWHPMTTEVVRQVQKYNPDKIILVPLYPQFSITTTGSSLEAWVKTAKKIKMNIQTSGICCYPTGKGFIDASVSLIKKTYLKATETANNSGLQLPRLLFSAHGLPEEIILAGDPYQEQIEKTTKAIVSALDLPKLDWVICYQSRVGPKKWIGPTINEELERAAKDGVPVIIYTHAFVSEHAETLVEIDIEYRQIAENLGIPYFIRVPTVGTKKEFITGLADMIKNIESTSGIYCNPDETLCIDEFTQCCLGNLR